MHRVLHNGRTPSSDQKAATPATLVVRAAMDRPAAMREMEGIRIEIRERMFRMPVTEHPRCPTSDCWKLKLCSRAGPKKYVVGNTQACQELRECQPGEQFVATS